MKEYLLRGITLFPILIATVSFVIFAGIGNTAFLFLFMGLGLLLPILLYIFNQIFAIWNRPSALSYQAAGTAFFLAYFIMNAYTLYAREADENAPEDKVRLRKTQATISMVTTAIIGLALLGLVLKSAPSMAFGIVAMIGGGALGYGWFHVLSACSADRLTDLFGIVSRIVPNSSTNRVKKVCYPVQ